MQITPLHTWIGQKISRGSTEYNKADLERYQLERLQAVIRHVRENSPFYRRLFSGCPENLESLPDLADFSFTYPDNIQEDPNRFLCVHPDEIERIVTLPTSGTTGPSKRIFFTASDQELTVDFFQVGMSTLTRPGDRVLILLPGQRPGSVGDLLRLGLERLGCTAIPYGPVDDESGVLRIIQEKDVNVMVGAPVQIHRLARWDQTNKILPKGQVRSLLASTDTLADTVRSNLQELWNCEVFDHYGMTETGLGGGVECEAHEGYHLREADLFYEIINPQSGLPLPDGQTGEVVVTTLTRVGMPLVRYRTGDLSRILPDRCTCGSFLRRLDRIRARVAAGISMADGMVFQTDLDEVLFQVEGLLDFSASFSGGAGFRVLKAACRFIEKSSHEDIILEKLRQITSIQTALDSGQLRVEISRMDYQPDPKTGYMFKRVLIDERP